MNLSEARKLQGEKLEKLIGMEIEAKHHVPDETAIVHRVVGGSVICRSQRFQGREYRLDPDQLTAVRDPDRAWQRAAEKERRAEVQRERAERRRAEKRARQQREREEVERQAQGKQPPPADSSGETGGGAQPDSGGGQGQ